MQLLELVLSPAEWREKAASEIGDVSRNHVFEVRIPISVGAGTWQVNVNGSMTTPIPFNVAGTLLAGLVGDLDTVGIGNVQTDGPRKGPYSMEFTGEMGGLDLNGIVTTASALVPETPVTISTVQVGQKTKYSADILKMWTGMGADTPEGIAKSPFAVRYAFIKAEIGKKRLGEIMGRTDTRDRDYEQKRSQEVAELRRVIADATNQLSSLSMALGSNGANSSLSGKIRQRTASGLDYGQVSIGGEVFGRR